MELGVSEKLNELLVRNGTGDCSLLSFTRRSLWPIGSLELLLSLSSRARAWTPWFDIQRLVTLATAPRGYLADLLMGRSKRWPLRVHQLLIVALIRTVYVSLQTSQPLYSHITYVSKL